MSYTVANLIYFHLEWMNYCTKESGPSSNMSPNSIYAYAQSNAHQNQSVCTTFLVATLQDNSLSLYIYI